METQIDDHIACSFCGLLDRPYISVQGIALDVRCSTCGSSKIFEEKNSKFNIVEFFRDGKR